MQIGFIGVGLMGLPMVIRLLKGGHGVQVVAHRNREPIERAVAAGARECRDLAELVTGCDALMVCVSNSVVVENTISAALPYLSEGKMVIDATTADPASTRSLASKLARNGVLFADAPLMGGPEQVAAGEAGALVGADLQVFERAAPLLACFCSRIVHFGPPGSGHTAKLISNALVCGMIALIADTYNLARKTGVDWKKLYEVQLTGSTNSGALKKMVARALTGDYDGYAFSIANAVKDIDYFVKMSDALGHPSPLARAASDYLQAAARRGSTERNISRLIDPAFAE